MGDMIARAALAAEKDAAEYARLRSWFHVPDIDLSGGSNYIKSDRHSAAPLSAAVDLLVVFAAAAIFMTLEGRRIGSPPRAT